jgi:hypothetical protein
VSVVTQMLADLANHRAETLSFVSIPDVEALRAEIQAAADTIGLNIVIRDATDHWLPIAPNQLYVMRFSDYASAYGLPPD